MLGTEATGGGAPGADAGVPGQALPTSVEAGLTDKQSGDSRGGWLTALVVGAGITLLSTAFALRKRGQHQF